jgi:hypothetical protein
VPGLLQSSMLKSPRAGIDEGPLIGRFLNVLVSEKEGSRFFGGSLFLGIGASLKLGVVEHYVGGRRFR